MTAQPWTPPGPEWVPGTPLWQRAPHHDGMFCYREETEREDCGCGDAAAWPRPKPGFGLGDGDELGDLIAAVRAEGL